MWRNFLDLQLPSQTPALPYVFFFFNDTATTEIYTLSLHDALPIFYYRRANGLFREEVGRRDSIAMQKGEHRLAFTSRSEEHTSELQSQSNLVCRLLLEKKNSADETDGQARTAADPDALVDQPYCSV